MPYILYLFTSIPIWFVGPMPALQLAPGAPPVYYVGPSIVLGAPVTATPTLTIVVNPPAPAPWTGPLPLPAPVPAQRPAGSTWNAVRIATQ
jgi:hypothetical protein